jgi:hypothetical protein
LTKLGHEVRLMPAKDVKVSRRCLRHGHVDLLPNKFGCEFRQTFISSFSPPIFDYNVLPLDVAEVA